jgi:hypothetical protein
MILYFLIKLNIAVISNTKITLPGIYSREVKSYTSMKIHVSVVVIFSHLKIWKQHKSPEKMCKYGKFIK